MISNVGYKGEGVDLNNKHKSYKADTGKPPFKASEGGCFKNLRGSEDITPSEFQQGKGTRVPIPLKVRLEASPNGLPMSVSLGGTIQNEDI